MVNRFCVVTKLRVFVSSRGFVVRRGSIQFSNCSSLQIPGGSGGGPISCIS